MNANKMIFTELAELMMTLRAGGGYARIIVAKAIMARRAGLDTAHGLITYHPGDIDKLLRYGLDNGLIPAPCYTVR